MKIKLILLILLIAMSLKSISQVGEYIPKLQVENLDVFDSIDMHLRKITQLGDPIFLKDAVNLQYLVTNYPRYSDSLYIFVTPIQLSDSLNLFTRLKDSLYVFVTPKQLLDSINNKTWSGVQFNSDNKIVKTKGSSGRELEQTGVNIDDLNTIVTTGNIESDTTKSDNIILSGGAGLNKIAVSSASGLLNWTSPSSINLNSFSSGTATYNTVATADGSGGVIWSITGGGISVKVPVKCVSTTDYDTTALSTVDSYPIVEGDRVLLVGQTDQKENGVYIATATELDRATDADSWIELYQAYVAVEEGTIYGGSAWYCTIPDLGTFNTDPITWALFSFPSSIEAGNGLSKTATTLSVNVKAFGGLEIDSDSLQIKESGVTNAMLSTGISATKIGNGSVSNTAFNYLNDVTDSIQEQLDSKADTTGIIRTGTSPIFTTIKATNLTDKYMPVHLNDATGLVDGPIIVENTYALLNKKLITIASTTGSAGFSILQGVAPTLPSNGDIWATASDAFIRLGDSTMRLTGGTNADWNAISGDALILNKPTSFIPAAHTLDSHSNMLITFNNPGEVLVWDGTYWKNRTLEEAGIQDTLVTGNLIELIPGLEFSNTRQVIGGNDTLKLSSGYFIPEVSDTAHWGRVETDPFYSRDSTLLKETLINFRDSIIELHYLIDSLLLGKIDTISGISSTEIGYLDGVTSPIQYQLDNLVLNTLKSGKSNLLVGTHTILFNSAYPNSLYEVNAFGKDGSNNVEVYVTNQNNLGFTVEVPFDCVVHWQATPNEVIDSVLIFGKYYNTITIGDQIWLAENLHYNDSGGEIYSYNDEADSSAIYGYLYSWSAALRVDALIAGWHLPSRTEFETLETSLGGESIAGGKLKETGTRYWRSPNTGATNEYGFSGRGAGVGTTSPSYSSIRDLSEFWTSTQFDATKVYTRTLGNDVATFNEINTTLKTQIVSIRLIKD